MSFSYSVQGYRVDFETTNERNPMSVDNADVNIGTSLINQGDQNKLPNDMLGPCS